MPQSDAIAGPPQPWRWASTSWRCEWHRSYRPTRAGQGRGAPVHRGMLSLAGRRRLFRVMANSNRIAGRLARAALGCTACLITASITTGAQVVRTSLAPAQVNGEPSIAERIAAGSSVQSISMLLDAGRDPLAPDGDGDTAMHTAAMVRDPTYLQLLLARQLSPDVPNRITGRTPIMSAMLAERDRQVTLLLAGGANVALADAMGNTPLHIAAQINEPGYVLALLEAGAPAAARNAQGQTFQRYLFMTADHRLNDETRRARRGVASWLVRRGIALETAAP